MRYVVTGGAGAIGSRLVQALLDLPLCEEVHVVDDLSSGHQWLLPDDRRVDFVDQDINEEVDIRPGDFVVHLAAHFANQNSVDEPRDDLWTNGEGTLALLMQAEKVGVSRFVFAGAACAQGHEDTPYQIHKTLGEAYCRYFKSRGVPTHVCRFHNSYGPGEVPGKYRNVIPNWVWLALQDEPLTVFGDGLDGRDYVFVEDLVEAMLRVSHPRSPTAVTSTIIGTGVWTSTLDLAHEIIDLTGSASKIVHAPRRSWDHKGAAASDHYMSRDPTPLREGLKKTIAWFEENRAKIAECVR